jgi:phosphomannomutase
VKVTISGVRGIFGKDFTLKDVLRFCNSFTVLVESKKCVIAHDTRPSAQMITETANAALMQCGIDTFNLGMAPTPVAFRESRKYGAGIIVTASHNPLEWNGLKFILDGRGINERELEIIKKEQDTKNNKIGFENVLESNYVEEAAHLIGNVSSRPKVTVDAGGGAAKNIAPALLEKIGCNVKIINKQLNQSSRGPDPTTDELQELISKTDRKGLGFAFDLDGDRLVVVKDGKKQAPDVTLGLGVAKALELGYKKFVLSIDTSVSIEKYIKKNGGQVQRSKVGEANVIDLMIKSKSDAGGEGSSGGFILPEFNYCRDGILTSGFIASMYGGNIFDEILEFMADYNQLRDKIAIDSKYHDKILYNIKEKLNKQYSKLEDQDGIKAIIDDDSWILVRKSNTEDIMRISAESNDDIKTKNILDDTKKLVNQIYEKIK